MLVFHAPMMRSGNGFADVITRTLPHWIGLRLYLSPKQQILHEKNRERRDRKGTMASTKKKSNPDVPIKLFKNQKAWEAWLARHGGSSTGVWLRLAKKSAEIQSLTYAEAVDAALCYGWIDGQKKSYDAESWLQKFTPRGPSSLWSKINRNKAMALIEQGRMRAAGLAAIERAKKNGRWGAAYDSHRTSVPPPDFVKALSQNPKAKAFFDSLNGQNRYAILFRIQTAKKPETRQKRIAQFIEMLEKNQKLHP
jgi:uncharacterized protein YdeI (YjbR/CyaY-like superfamily)